MKPLLVISIIALGMILLVLSTFWVQWFPGTSSWSPEKTELWDKTKARLETLSYIVNSDEPPRRLPSKEAAQKEYEEVKATHERLTAEFKAAYDSPRTTATALKWSGIVCVAVGVVAHLAWKDGA